MYLKFARRFLSLLLTACMLLGAAPAALADDNEPVESTVGLTAGAAVFAPDYLVQFENGVLNNTYEVKDDADAFKSKYVYIPSGSQPSNGNMDAPWTLPAADASFTFNIPKDGTYYLWFRYFPEWGAGSNSAWVKWDGEPTEKTGWIRAGWDSTLADFGWSRSVWQDAAVNSVTLTAGTHTLYWTHRHKGQWMDAVYLTSDPAVVPPATTNFQVDRPALFIDADLTTLEGAYTIRGDQPGDLQNSLIGRYISIPTTAQHDTNDNKLKDAAMQPEPDAAFTFDIPQDGRYYLWFRYCRTDVANNSFHIKWDEGGWTTLWMEDVGEFKWTAFNADGTRQGALAVNLTAGTHTLYWTHRNILLNMDAVYLTADVNAVPGDSLAPGEGELTRRELPGNVYPAPSILPPDGHPRLLFRADDIPMILANYSEPQNTAAKRAFEALVAAGTDGNLPDTSTNNYNGQILGVIEAMAFSYAVFGDVDSGLNAVTAIKNYLPAVRFAGISDNCRAMGHTIFVASEVYDWCYDLLADDDKLYITYHCENIARNADGTGLEVGYPPSGQGAVCGHGSEAQILRDLLSLGIATYGDYSDIYNYVGGRFFQDFVEPRNFWYTSNTQHQGSAYGYVRFGWDMWSAWIIKRMSGIDVYDPAMQYVAYEWLYTRRPDGQIFRAGDDFIEGQQTGYFRLDPIYFFTASYFGDEYMKYEALRENANFGSFNYNNGTLTPVDVLLFNDPHLGTKTFNSLPNSKYFGSPAGYMAARTGWAEGITSNVTAAMMKITEYWGANHHHLEAGSFQLYYKGILASDSGFYDSYGTAHDYNYHKRSVAHNTITVYDPNEVFNYHGIRNNDGGQRVPGNGGEPSTMDRWMAGSEYRTGSVLGHEFGPDLNYPEYTYIKGDITDAYSNKVSEALRSMVFLPLDDPDHPAAMIVMDKVTAADPSFKKAYLLHMQQEPVLEGVKTTVLNTAGGNNGKMVNETLLPRNPVLTMIGGPGREFEVDGINYPFNGTIRGAMEPGWGRVEVSPREANKTDFFLNVMTVSDADGTAPDLASTLIEGEGWVGAVVSNRAALFATEAARIENELKFTIPGSGPYKAFVSGIKEGTWQVSTTGEMVIATEDGGVVYFNVDAGTEVILTYVNNSAVRPPIEPLPPDESRSGYTLKVGANAVYCDVDPIASNGSFLVQGSSALKALMATGVVYDRDTKTLSAVTKEGIAVSVTDGSLIARFGLGILPMTVAPRDVNGVLMVPIEFLADALYTTSSWDQLTYTLTLTPGNKPQRAMDTAHIIGCGYSGYFQNQIGENSYDGNIDYINGTLWSVDGANGAWIWYEFDDIYTVKSALIHFNNYNTRTTDFTLSYSLDGNEWTPIEDPLGKGYFTSDGATYGEIVAFKEPVEAKFIKYDFIKNSTSSTFAAIRNIAFLAVAPFIESVTVTSGAVLPGMGGTVTVEATGQNLEDQLITITLDGMDIGAALLFEDGRYTAEIPIPANTSNSLVFHTIEAWLNGTNTGEKTYVAVEAMMSTIVATGVTTGTRQADIDFNIRSANGKGYTVYLSVTGESDDFAVYTDVNFDSKGVHIRGLENGVTYYVYIIYTDGAAAERSEILTVTLPFKK